MTYGPIAMPMFSSYAERIEQRFQTIVQMHDLVTPQAPKDCLIFDIPKSLNYLTADSLALQGRVGICWCKLEVGRLEAPCRTSRSSRSHFPDSQRLPLPLGDWSWDLNGQSSEWKHKVQDDGLRLHNTPPFLLISAEGPLAYPWASRTMVLGL